MLSEEHHLFILWENSRSKEREIINDIKDTFSIVETVEMVWTKEKFSENLSRFYGLKLPKNSGKEEHCGTGPFLVIIVKDKTPEYRKHRTSRGIETVNTKTFMAKTRYRDITGGGHKIHGTNSTEEFRHDMTLLFGPDLADYVGRTKKAEIIERDIIGSVEWKDLRQLFSVLNNTLNYVVIRNFDILPDKFYALNHGDIDLLVENYEQARLIMNAEPVFTEPHRVYCSVLVAGELVYFDLRFLGDDYYSQAWESNILINRKLEAQRSIYVPSEDDYRYSLLYHAVIHKPSIAEDYEEKLRVLFGDICSDAVLSKQCLIKELAKYIAKNGYSVTRPEPSVRFNVRNANKIRLHCWARRPIFYLSSRIGRLLAPNESR